MYFKNAIEAIGHTPLVEIAQMSPSKKVKILAKLEGQNVGGSASIKDRVAKYMLEKAEQSGELTKGSRLLWYRDECVQMLKDLKGLKPEEMEREDPYFHMAYKAKVHRVAPEAAYTARFEFEDEEPLERESYYRIRVEQRNGQRAWSSPIWVEPASPGR